jgi:hypothetical protein
MTGMEALLHAKHTGYYLYVDISVLLLNQETLALDGSE